MNKITIGRQPELGNQFPHLSVLRKSLQPGQEIIDQIMCRYSWRTDHSSGKDSHIILNFNTVLAIMFVVDASLNASLNHITQIPS